MKKGRQREVASGDKSKGKAPCIFVHCNSSIYIRNVWDA
jgi:hypothetical protein